MIPIHLFLKSFWKSIGTKSFRSNFKKLTVANLIAQSMLLIAAPILSRLFKPENFGELALYVSITSIVTSIATLRFDWLVPNPRNDNIAATLMAAGISFLFLITFIFLISILIMGDVFIPEEFLSLRSLAPLMALGVFGVGLHNIYIGWYIRTSNLTEVSKVNVIQSFSNIFISISLGILGFTESGLIFATIFSSLFGISLLVYGASELRSFFINIKFNKLIETIKDFSNQALLSTAVSGMNTFSSRVMILLFALIYSPYQVGLVIFAHQLISKPVMFIAKGISKSFWAHAAELCRLRDYQSLRKDFLKITYILCGLSVLLIFFSLAVQPFIVLLFGSDWNEMGLVLIMLMPMVCGAAIFSPTNHLVVLGRQGLQLFADILRIVFICITSLIAFLFELDFVFTVLTVSCSSLLGYLILFLIQLRVHRGLIYK